MFCALLCEDILIASLADLSLVVVLLVSMFGMLIWNVCVQCVKMNHMRVGRARKRRERRRKFRERGNRIKDLLELNQNRLPCHAQLLMLHFLGLLVITRENPGE